MRVFLSIGLMVMALPLTALGGTDPLIQPRTFGYFIGDVFSQRIAIDPGIKDFSSITLPPNDRISLWFERSNSRIVTALDGQTWIAVTTQIINSPREPIQAVIPALSIAVSGREPLTIPALSVSIGPLAAHSGLTPANADSDSLGILPDKAASQRLAQPQQMTRDYWLLALALSLLSWLGWTVWRNRRDRKRLPFEHAWRAIRQRAKPNQDPLAWQSLHQAINQTAGRTIQLSELDSFISAAPYLSAQRDQIERFFQRSNQRFFARDDPADSDAEFDLLNLCRELRHLQKRSAR